MPDFLLILPPIQTWDSSVYCSLKKYSKDCFYSVISEKERKRFYHTIERLRKHLELQKFLSWIARKPPEFYDGSTKINAYKN